MNLDGESKVAAVARVLTGPDSEDPEDSEELEDAADAVEQVDPADQVDPSDSETEIGQ